MRAYTNHVPQLVPRRFDKGLERTPGDLPVGDVRDDGAQHNRERVPEADRKADPHEPIAEECGPAAGRRLRHLQRQIQQREAQVLLLRPAPLEQAQQAEEGGPGDEQEGGPLQQRHGPQVPRDSGVAGGLEEAPHGCRVAHRVPVGEAGAQIGQTLVVQRHDEKRQQPAHEAAAGHGDGEHQHAVDDEDLAPPQGPTRAQAPQQRVQRRQREQREHRRHRRHAALNLPGVVDQRHLLHEQTGAHREHQRQDECAKAQGAPRIRAIGGFRRPRSSLLVEAGDCCAFTRRMRRRALGHSQRPLPGRHRDRPHDSASAAIPGPRRCR